MPGTGLEHQQRVAQRYAAAAQRIIDTPVAGAVCPDEADTIGQRLYTGQLDPDRGVLFGLGVSVYDWKDSFGRLFLLTDPEEYSRPGKTPQWSPVHRRVEH